jgi:hypothetical protein
MAHGYMREYDEDYDRDEMRDRGSERGSHRNRDFMMGDRDRSWDEERNRNFDRGSSQSISGHSSWDGGWDRDRHSSPGQSQWTSSINQRQSGGHSSHQDDHYRSWRDKQMEALDRDYADYCKEREQQFHSDFDTWRSQRRDSVQPLRTGMTQTGTGTNPEGMPDIATDLETSAQGQKPMADATVGTAPNSNRR